MPTVDVPVTDELPFGTRGGLVVRHYFPVAGDYSFKIELQKDYYRFQAFFVAQQAGAFAVGGIQARDPAVAGVEAQELAFGERIDALAFHARGGRAGRPAVWADTPRRRDWLDG